MPVQSTNPDYDAHIAEWEMMDDALEGECAVKRNERNLPKPSGMVEAEKLDGAGNKYLYENYTNRAQYEHWVRDSLRSMMGLVSRLIPEIELPAGLKGLEDNATSDGFGLKQLFFRMVRQAISHGRVPLVVNIDDSGEPYFSTYATRNAINWDTADQGGRQDLVLSVFREFRKKGGDRYSHDCDAVFREFFMLDRVCYTAVRNEAGELIDDERPLGTTGTDNRLVKGLPYLPVIYCGSTDNSPDVDEVPLLTMARAALKSYQLSADYFTSLHQTSHPQPWVSGLDEAVELSVTGPSAAWDLGPSGSCGYWSSRAPASKPCARPWMTRRMPRLKLVPRSWTLQGLSRARRAKHARTTSTQRCTASSSQWPRRWSRGCAMPPSGRDTTLNRSSSR